MALPGGLRGEAGHAPRALVLRAAAGVGGRGSEGQPLPAGQRLEVVDQAVVAAVQRKQHGVLDDACAAGRAAGGRGSTPARPSTGSAGRRRPPPARRCGARRPRCRRSPRGGPSAGQRSPPPRRPERANFAPAPLVQWMLASPTCSMAPSRPPTNSQLRYLDEVPQDASSCFFHAVLTFRLTQFKLFQARMSKKQKMMRFGLAVLFGGDCLRFRVFCNEACNRTRLFKKMLITLTSLQILDFGHQLQNGGVLFTLAANNES